MKNYLILFYFFLGTIKILSGQCPTSTILSSQPGLNLGFSMVEIENLSSITPLEEGYMDYTSSDTVILGIKGGNYEIKLYSDADEYQWAAAWIDWNQDGRFDSTEKLFPSDPDISPEDENILEPHDMISRGFSMPNDAKLGITKLRVAADNFENSFPEPCQQETGDVEDYTVNIIELPKYLAGRYSDSRFLCCFRPGIRDKIVLNLKIDVAYTLGLLEVQDIFLSLEGTDNFLDIENLKLWSSGLEEVPYLTNQFGVTIQNPNVNEMISGSLFLETGRNHVWASLDVSESAGIGDTIRVRCDSIRMADGKVYNMTNGLSHFGYTVIDSLYERGNTKRNNMWYFGLHGGIDFNCKNPIPIWGALRTGEGCAAVSDSNGAILFYSNGIHVFDRMHDTMPNGYDLLGGYSSTQSVTITPVIGNNNQYYIFTTDGVTVKHENGSIFLGLNYSIIDMTLNNGMGDIMPEFKNINLTDSVGEKITVAAHSSPYKYWIVTQKDFSNIFYAYLVSCNGISDTPVISQVGKVGGRAGYMKVTKDQKEIINADYYNDEMQIFDFDNSTGKLSNVRTFSKGTSTSTYVNNSYGFQTSPNDSLIYVLEKNIIACYERFANDINASKILVDTISISIYEPSVGGIQLGPDGKIYISTYRYLAVIHNPNDKINPQIEFESIKLLDGTRAQGGFPVNFYEVPELQKLTLGLSDSSLGCNIHHINSENGFNDYVWSTGEQDTNQILVKETNTYILSATDSFGCLAQDSIYVNIDTSMSFLQSATMMDTTICLGQSIQLSARNILNQSWFPSVGLSNPNNENTIASPEQSTIYLSEIKDSNCVVIDTFKIEVTNCPVFIPNSFSPSGNTLSNKTFKVHAEGITSFNIKIYNRRGNLLYETDDIEEEWDGKTLQGKQIKNDVVIYNLSIHYLNQSALNLKGNIFIN